MATSRRTFLEITVGATALTMVRSLADAVVLSEQTATSAPAVPVVVRVHAAQIRPKTPRLRLDKDSYEMLRKQVLRRDGWRCQLCGSTSNLEVHHQQFRSHAGADEERNLIKLFSPCHKAQHRR